MRILFRSPVPPPSENANREATTRQPYNNGIIGLIPIRRRIYVSRRYLQIPDPIGRSRLELSIYSPRCILSARQPRDPFVPLLNSIYTLPRILFPFRARLFSLQLIEETTYCISLCYREESHLHENRLARRIVVHFSIGNVFVLIRVIQHPRNLSGRYIHIPMNDQSIPILTETLC